MRDESRLARRKHHLLLLALVGFIVVMLFLSWIVWQLAGKPSGPGSQITITQSPVLTNLSVSQGNNAGLYFQGEKWYS